MSSRGEQTRQILGRFAMSESEMRSAVAHASDRHTSKHNADEGPSLATLMARADREADIEIKLDKLRNRIREEPDKAKRARLKEKIEELEEERAAIEEDDDERDTTGDGDDTDDGVCSSFAKRRDRAFAAEMARQQKLREKYHAMTQKSLAQCKKLIKARAHTSANGIESLLAAGHSAAARGRAYSPGQTFPDEIMKPRVVNVQKRDATLPAELSVLPRSALERAGLVEAPSAMSLLVKGAR